MHMCRIDAYAIFAAQHSIRLVISQTTTGNRHTREGCWRSSVPLMSFFVVGVFDYAWSKISALFSLGRYCLMQVDSIESTFVCFVLHAILSPF